MKIAPHLGPHGMKGQYVMSAPELGVPLITEVEWRGFSAGSAHSHGECQMLAVLAGGMRLELGGREFEIGPGGVAVLPAAVEHCVESEAGMRFLDIRFSLQPNSPLIAINHMLQGQAVWQARPRTVTALSREFRRAYERGGAPGVAAAMAAVWKLIEAMLRSARESLRSEAKSRRYVSADRRLAQAEGFVRDHLASNLSVESIAEHVGISRSQLSRLFERDLGTSPAAYLRQMRVKRAQKLLEGSTLSVKEISAVCGFVCPHHFHRVFRQIAGKTPGKVRAGR